MQGDIRDQLEALRKEVRVLSKAFIELRQEDIRRVFGDQIRPILVERIDKFISKSKANGQTEIGHSIEYKMRLISLVDEAISHYQEGAKAEAIRFLDEYEPNPDNHKLSSNNSDYENFVQKLIEELRDYFETSETIAYRSMPNGGLMGSPLGKEMAELSPIQIEKVLGPLANSWRIKVLTKLSKDDESLARISKVLGLKKGHLQFHLKILLNADYIQYNRKSHLYSLTDKGEIALDEIARLSERLRSI